MIKVAIAGATGFVGQKLVRKLLKAGRYEVHALTRRVRFTAEDQETHIIWKQCDAFSPMEVELALKDVDVAIYLIHSMGKHATLEQGGFENFDLILADNFSRGAAKNGVKQIIYLGGIIPQENQESELSPHLRSRLEVEKILASRGTPVTTLRSGVIIGKNSSSFQIMEKLIRRLPIILTPPWAEHYIQPIDVGEVTQLLINAIQNQKIMGKSVDIGGSEVFQYIDLLKETALVLKLERKFIKIPFFPKYLTKLFTSILTGVDKQLVYPLIESLDHSMVADPKNHFKLEHHMTFQQSFTRVLSFENGLQKMKLNVPQIFKVRLNFKWLRTVRSIQRFELPKGKDAKWAAEEYFNWVSIYFLQLLQVTKNNNKVSFKLFGVFSVLTLLYSPERSSPDRQVFYLVGGWLVKRTQLTARMGFRVTCGDTLTIAIHDYQPSYPWFLYKYSQAFFHRWAMGMFGRYLRRRKTF